MELVRTTLDRLALDDRTFDLGFARRYEALQRSVAVVGVLQPPLARLREGDGRCQIVCGFGRAFVAQSLRHSEISALILDPATSDADCLRLAFFDNLPHRQFNPIERAIILAKLGRYVSRNQLLSDYMPLLAMQPSGALLDRTLPLTRLVHGLKRAVAEGRIEEKVGALLARLPENDQEAFGRLLEQCRPSVSVVREWAEMLTDVARRDHRPLSDLLARPEVTAVLNSTETTDAERTATLRHLFENWRYPEFAAYRRQFSEARAALHLPPAMKLEAAPSFESDEMRLEIRFRSEKELRHAATVLSRWFDDPDLLNRLWQMKRQR